ncbi:MAG: NAD(P)-binding protein [Deltaproteobacteria bacterium]|nr:NAD(P)-binding protein [Deltaproteobacteria bacterium]
MAILLKNIPLFLDEEESTIQKKIGEILGVSAEHIREIRVVRKSLDARRKNRVHFVYSLEISLPPEEEEKVLQEAKPNVRAQKVLVKPPEVPAFIQEKPKHRPLIVGTGPAGLFAALKLTESGLPPLIIERGKEIAGRIKDVEKFWRDGTLETESNVQFGEGGAGTFSDGKLFTRLHDSRISAILETFFRFGAPAEILYLQRPHIGTDRLRRVILAMRNYLQEQGAEFKFQTKMTKLKIFRGGLRGIIINEREEVDTSVLLLGPGNSARDTFRMLKNSGVAMEPKPLAIGLRVEHPQRLIDRIQYGPSAGHPRLPPAEYQLTYCSSTGRAVYSFCMCPGGSVIAASSEARGLVTNGMSLFRRDSPLANSALVVGVRLEDFGGSGPLAGMEFQRRWEEKAFWQGGGNFHAPAQRLLDFLQGQGSSSLSETSFKPGVTPSSLDTCLPAFVVESLREVLPYFNRKMPGFSSSEATLIGIETRTSSPLRILRNEGYQSQSVRGLYPIGEGSGYAGGIISSALDGIKAAEAVLKKFE